MLEEIIQRVVSSYIFTIARVVLFAGTLFLVLWKLQWFKSFFKRIPNRNSKIYPKNEFFLTIFTLLIMQLPAVVLIVLKNKFNYTPIYTDINAYGIPYFLLSIFMFAFIFDTLFYWTHRLMHHKSLFNFFHKTHHKFNNPTPWAAYGVNFFEALVLATSYLIALLSFPWHPMAALIYATSSILFSCYVHSGYEFFPKAFLNHPIFKWLNTSTHHNLHHQDYKYNFAIYFTFWDKLFKTEHPKQLQVFEKLSD